MCLVPLASCYVIHCNVMLVFLTQAQGDPYLVNMTDADSGILNATSRLEQRQIKV